MILYQIINTAYQDIYNRVCLEGARLFKVEDIIAFEPTCHVDAQSIDEAIDILRTMEYVNKFVPVKNNAPSLIKCGDIIEKDKKFYMVGTNPNEYDEINIASVVSYCPWCGFIIHRDHDTFREAPDLELYHEDCYGELYAYDECMSSKSLQFEALPVKYGDIK
jgi:hypothetical protein